MRFRTFKGNELDLKCVSSSDFTATVLGHPHDVVSGRIWEKEEGWAVQVNDECTHGHGGYSRFGDALKHLENQIEGALYKAKNSPCENCATLEKELAKATAGEQRQFDRAGHADAQRIEAEGTVRAIKKVIAGER